MIKLRGNQFINRNPIKINKLYLMYKKPKFKKIIIKKENRHILKLEYNFYYKIVFIYIIILMFIITLQK